MDLLGNMDVIADVLRVASGVSLEDNIVSNISRIAEVITLPEE